MSEPAEWRRTTLGEICRQGRGGIQTGPFGSQLHASDYVLEGIPSVMPMNIGDNIIVEDGIARISEADATRLSRYRLADGDIVYSRRGDVEKRALVRESNAGWLCGTGCLRVRFGPESAHDSRFFSYLLGTQDARDWVVRHAVGATMPNLNTSILAAIPLVVPPLDVQQAIAMVLGTLDDKIAANTKESGLIDEFITARFRAAFVGGQVQSVPLFEAMAIDFGEAFKGTSFSAPGEGRPLIRIRDLKTFSPQIWTIESRAREVTVMSGDIVVGMDAEFRATTWLAESGLLNQRVCRVRGHGLGNAFVREALRGPLAAIENQKSATTVIHLNKSDMERMEIEIPGAVSLSSFEDDAEHLYLLRVKLELENRTLAATRDALLPQLMSGKLRVRDGEENLEVAR